MDTTVTSSSFTNTTPYNFSSFQDNVSNTIFDTVDKVSIQMTTDTSYPFEYYIFMFAYWKFNFYGYYIINSFGIFTNLLVIAAVVSSQKLRKTSAGLLITVLAIADLLTCTTGIIVNLMYFNEHLNVRPFCLIIEYIWSTMRSFSHWIMVIISVNRFALVCYPFKHSRITSIKSTIYQLLALFIVCSTTALYKIFGRDSEGGDCYLNADTENLWIYYISTVVIGFSVGSVAPIIITLCLTILVCRALRRKQESLGAVTSTTTAQKQVTKALVASNVTFILLSVPYFSLYIPYFMDGWLVYFPERVSYNVVTAVLILNVIECANYVINIFLYTWYSPKFRQSLFGLLKCKCHSDQAPSSNTGKENTQI